MKWIFGCALLFLSLAGNTNTKTISSSTKPKKPDILNISYSESISSKHGEVRHKRCRLSNNKQGQFVVACDVAIDTNESVNFIIKNTSLSVTALNIRAQLPSNWTDVSQDASACKQLSPGQSCQLHIQSGGFARARAVFAIKGSNTQSINVAVTVNATQFAYIVSMNSDNVTKCIVQPDGTLESCNIEASGFNAPNDIFFMPDNSFAYITNSNSVSKCPVNTNGAFGSCSQASNITNTVRGAVNPSGTKTFITNFTTDRVIECDIDGNNNLFGCGDTGLAFTNPDGITFTSNGTRSYVVQNSNPVDLCNSDVTSCSTTASFTFPTTITLNSAETIAYIVEVAGNVEACNLDGSGELINCMQTNIAGSAVTSLALNQANDRAFITNSANNIIISCHVSGKTLSNCFNTGSLLDDPFSIRIRNF